VAFALVHLVCGGLAVAVPAHVIRLVPQLTAHGIASDDASLFFVRVHGALHVAKAIVLLFLSGSMTAQLSRSVFAGYALHAAWAAARLVAGQHTHLSFEYTAAFYVRTPSCCLLACLPACLLYLCVILH
jgi:hypothetical protein